MIHNVVGLIHGCKPDIRSRDIHKNVYRQSYYQIFPLIPPMLEHVHKGFSLNYMITKIQDVVAATAFHFQETGHPLPLGKKLNVFELMILYSVRFGGKLP